MSASMSNRLLLPANDTRVLLIKWVVALLVPVVVFTLWSGESIVNAVISPQTSSLGISTDPVALLAAAIFVTVFYASTITLAGYLVAADSGRRGIIELWIDVFIFTLVPLILVVIFHDLILGLALCAVVWPVYFFVRGRVRKARHYIPPPPLESLEVLDVGERSILISRATAGGFWFGTAFAVVTLITDLVYFVTGSLPTLLLIWALIRTLVLPIAGYFLGRLAGVIALRRTLAAKGNGGNGANRVGNGIGTSLRQQLEVLSTTRAREEAKDLVPNDLPLRSTGAQRFYLILLVAFVLFYPVLDPFLFGSGTDGRLAGYGDAGFYVILALG